MFQHGKTLGAIAGAGLGGYLAYNYCNQDDTTTCDSEPKTVPKAEATPQATPTPRRKNCELIDEVPVANMPGFKYCIYKCRGWRAAPIIITQYANLPCPDEDETGMIPRPNIPGVYP